MRILQERPASVKAVLPQRRMSSTLHPRVRYRFVPAHLDLNPALHVSPIRVSEVSGHAALTLENDLIQVTVIPDLGGRIWDLVDRTRRVNWIWHRPNVPLVNCATGADYDTVWAGGWEELFPNDAPGPFEGRTLPDHGEWWARNWAVTEIEDGETLRIRLTCQMGVIRARCVKEISLARGDSRVDVTYAIESEEPLPFHFLFKQHLPLDITPGCRLLLPDGLVTPVDSSFSTVLTSAEPTRWPGASRHPTDLADLSHVPSSSSRLQEFVYVSELQAGACRVINPEGATLAVSWDLATMPFLWLFLSYGGWRDVYTAVLEPCSNMPKDLAQAASLGQAAVLRPGERFETWISVTVGGEQSA